MLGSIYKFIVSLAPYTSAVSTSKSSPISSSSNITTSSSSSNITTPSSSDEVLSLIVDVTVLVLVSLFLDAVVPFAVEDLAVVFLVVVFDGVVSIIFVVSSGALR